MSCTKQEGKWIPVGLPFVLRPAKVINSPSVSTCRHPCPLPPPPPPPPTHRPRASITVRFAVRVAVHVRLLPPPGLRLGMRATCLNKALRTAQSQFTSVTKKGPGTKGIPQKSSGSSQPLVTSSLRTIGGASGQLTEALTMSTCASAWTHRV